MSLNSKSITYLQDKDNLNGKKEKILIIECKNCLEIKPDFNKNQKCLSCFLNTLFINKKKDFKYILIKSYDRLIEYNEINSILDYFKNLVKIEKSLKRIKNFYEKKCIYRDFNCKLFPNLHSLFTANNNDFTNPILLYSLLLSITLNRTDKRIIDSVCQNCISFLNPSFEYLLNILNKQKIILEYNKFHKKSLHSSALSFFYDNYLSKKHSLPEHNSDSHIMLTEKKEAPLTTYEIGKDGLFQVFIFDIANENENFYEIKTLFESNLENLYFNKIIDDVEENLDFIKIDQIIPIESLLKIYKNEAINYVESKYRLTKHEKNKIAFLAALKKINLEKLFPLLIDDYIEEIFLDSPQETIYLNHQTYSRCRTNIKFDMKEINRLKTLLRIYSGKRLDYVNPSIKFVIKNEFFYCRFSMDVEPIHLSKFALDIRKLDKNILTIQDLLQNKTLSPFIAAFLYFNVLRRKNITVIGETDTGKTTLINALDLLTPKEFRKIYIEDVIESLNQFSFSRHQLKYKVDSMEETLDQKFSKQNQIKKLLHRTPDIIYLGEILTKEEAEAMFHCLAAGLRGFQTIHSKDINSLINRLVHHFNIHPSCLHDLDLIILMKKLKYKRMVVSISEINPNNEENLYNVLFIYNPDLKQWNLMKDLYESSTINQIKQYEAINKEIFYDLMKIYVNIFEFLTTIKKISTIDLIEFFDKISYYSWNSIDTLKDFWENWKKARSLYY